MSQTTSTTSDPVCARLAPSRRRYNSRVISTRERWRSVIVVILALRDPDLSWRFEDHDPAPSYTCRKICMVGDAAHAAMSFNEQGAAQSIQDAAVLMALFANATELEQIERAFNIYDELRRLRMQKVAELSWAFRRMYLYAEEKFGDGLDKSRVKPGVGAKYSNDVDQEVLNEVAVTRLLEADQWLFKKVYPPS